MPDDPRPDFDPDWPVCTQCQGVRLEGRKVCVAHLGDLAEYEPNGELDLRGVTVDSALLAGVLGRFRDHDAKKYVFTSFRCDHAWFPGRAWFTGVQVAGAASFAHANFSGPTTFRGVVADTKLSFVNARFAGPTSMSGLMATSIDLEGAWFALRLPISSAATKKLDLMAATFEDGAEIGSTGAVSAVGTRFGGPSKISNTAVLSLAHSDVSNLVLTDVDLRDCSFLGAHRLDQLRLDGSIFFATPPGRWRTRRRLLADERDVAPQRVVALYRSLRKSFEDSKNEAGAGDFYYGEMEARRHSKESSLVERAILSVYWAVSGYGQRASRALAALVAVLAVVTGVLMVAGQDFGLAARVALGTALSKDPQVALTATGEWIVLVARFLGPVLLALALLAVRARVKR